MSEEAPTPGLVELLRRADEAADRHDIDALMSFYAPDAVWDMSAVGIGVFEGADSIRAFFEEWWATWEEHDREVEERHDFGHGIVFGAVREHGRLVGSDKRVEHTRGWVAQWAGGVATKVTLYLGVDEARAAAARAAEERGSAKSQENVDAFAAAVRSGQRAFNDGDFEAAFAGLAPDVEWHSGAWILDAETLRGRAAVIEYFRGLQDAGDWQVEALDVVEAGEGVFVVHQRGRAVGRTTRIAGTLDFFQVWEIGWDGLVAQVREYQSRGDALGAAGLEE